MTYFIKTRGTSAIGFHCCGAAARLRVECVCAEGRRDRRGGTKEQYWDGKYKKYTWWTYQAAAPKHWTLDWLLLTSRMLNPGQEVLCTTLISTPPGGLNALQLLPMCIVNIDHGPKQRGKRASVELIKTIAGCTWASVRPMGPEKRMYFILFACLD